MYEEEKASMREVCGERFSVVKLSQPCSIVSGVSVRKIVNVAPTYATIVHATNFAILEKYGSI